MEKGIKRKGLRGVFYSTTYSSPVGKLTLGSDGDGLVGLWIEGQRFFGETVSEGMTERAQLPVFEATASWLDRYFAGEKPLPEELPLKPSGGQFRQAVWRLLLEIPYGEVVSYGDIAKKLARGMGKKAMSAQAVGGAVGHNPISIIIPCHRVVGASGSLTGYGGGLEIKTRLLEHEGADMSHLFVPKGR